MSKNKVSALIVGIWVVLFLISIFAHNPVVSVICFGLTLCLIALNLVNLYGRGK